MKSRLQFGFYVLTAATALHPLSAQQTSPAETPTSAQTEQAPAANNSPTGKKKRQGGGPEDPERPFRPPVPPILSPEDALKTFKLPAGFKIQTVAAEPLVETPVAVAWDAKGRMYVVEMRGYMPDMDATGEDQPVGRIKFLEDTNGDGVYDKASVFVDNLVMPRAVIATGDGVLVVTPPTLTFHRDTDHDGVADTSELVDDKVGTLGGQPEYLPNSPLYALDNWITLSHHTLKYQYQQGVFTSALAGKSGQWGRSQDDWGRQFFNYNSDLLRTDLVPPLWYNRNPRLAERTAINVQVIKDQVVWPGHPNPGINRGYAPKGLREDGTQAATTATCGPGIYRGDLFPAEFQGNAFVPEPAGNLVKRLRLKDQAGSVSAENAYKDREFLTSTDERFRPVNALTGPDGALYIVDMARGVIQHKVFLSYYLAANIEERKLEQPINLGRIYRIVPDGAKPTAVQLPSSPAELVTMLSHKNGWVRDNAQRLIVESGDLSVTQSLEKLFKIGKTRQSRIHALWTLEGLHALTRETIQAALKDKEPKVRAAGVRLLTDATWQYAFLPSSQPQGNDVSNQAPKVPMFVPSVEKDLDALLNDKDPEVQMLAAFQLAATNTPDVRKKLTTLLKASGSPLVAQGIACGIAGNELAYLQDLLALAAADSRWLLSSGILKTLAACVMNERNGAKIGTLIAAAGALPANGSLQAAVLEGMAGKAPDKAKKTKPGSGPRPVNLPAEPPALATLAASAKPATAELLERINRQIMWPGKPLPEGAKPPPAPLNADEKLQFTKGKELYGTVCIACHQPNGAGLPGLAPTLVNSEWVNGPANRAIRIILQGLTGPIEVAGTTWQMEMPAVTMFNDEQVAAILTYIRREWDNDGSVVTPADVSKVRAEINGRTSAWTAKELAEVR